MFVDKMKAAISGKSMTVNVNVLITSVFAILKAFGLDVVPEDPDTFILLYATGLAALNIIIRIFKTTEPIENK
jgi:hypothetical protein